MDRLPWSAITLPPSDQQPFADHSLAPLALLITARIRVLPFARLDLALRLTLTPAPMLATRRKAITT